MKISKMSHPAKFLASGCGWVCWLGFSMAAAAAPELRVAPSGDRVTVTIEDGVAPKGWVLQDSYDGSHWRDLVDLQDLPFSEAVSAAPTRQRLFRAAQKPPATRQEAIDQARARWIATGLTLYQYRHQTNGAFFLTDDLILVKNDKIAETTSLLPPEWPGFAWGLQTVDDLFDRLQRAIDDDAYAVNVRYHPSMGCPEKAYVDYNEFIADEEWGFTNLSLPENPESLRAASEQQWERAQVAVCEFDLNYQTARYQWKGRVRVENGQATVIVGGAPASDHIIMTLEGYFASMKESLAAGRVTSLLFDPTDGHPLFFSRDWHLTQVDGLGERFWFSAFRKLGGR